jgi:hypothetical protein
MRKQINAALSNAYKIIEKMHLLVNANARTVTNDISEGYAIFSAVRYYNESQSCSV